MNNQDTRSCFETWKDESLIWKNQPWFAHNGIIRPGPSVDQPWFAHGGIIRPATFAYQPRLVNCGILSQLWAIHPSSSPVYSDGYSVTPDRVLRREVRSNTARPSLRSIKGGWYQRGPRFTIKITSITTRKICQKENSEPQTVALIVSTTFSWSGTVFKEEDISKCCIVLEMSPMMDYAQYVICDFPRKHAIGQSTYIIVVEKTWKESRVNNLLSTDRYR